MGLIVKDRSDVELVETIDAADGSVINIFQPKEKPSKEEMSSFIEFIVDLKYRDMQLKQAAEAKQV